MAELAIGDDAPQDLLKYQQQFKLAGIDSELSRSLDATSMRELLPDVPLGDRIRLLQYVQRDTSTSMSDSQIRFPSDHSWIMVQKFFEGQEANARSKVSSSNGSIGIVSGLFVGTALFQVRPAPGIVTN